MSFSSSIKTFKSIDDLKSHILFKDNYREPHTINIYHIHIGSKTNLSDGSNYSHNHEYTLFLQTLFNNPLKQFSPEFISQLQNYTDIKIRNVVILIDPYYSISTELEGYQEFNKSKTVVNSLQNEIVEQHTNHSLTTIKTSIEILQLPFDIVEYDILNIIDILTNIGNLYSVLINIMDCTSNVMLDFYSKYKYYKYNNKIHLTRPNCLIIDKLPLYNPIITSSGINIFQGQISVRWINYYEDMKIIPELEQVLDFCENSQNTYTYITTHYKHIIALEELICIMKLLSRLSYSIDEEIDIYPNTDVNSDDGSRTSLLLIKFCEISFTDFIKFWKNFVIFQDYILSNVDSYYRCNLKIYIDRFIDKYEEVSNHITIIKALQFEAIDIFKNLINYCKTDSAYIITNIKGIGEDTSHLLERKHILDYLKFNNVSI